MSVEYRFHALLRSNTSTIEDGLFKLTYNRGFSRAKIFSAGIARNLDNI